MNFIWGLLSSVWFLLGIISLFTITYSHKTLKVKDLIVIIVFLPHHLLFYIVMIVLISLEKVISVFKSSKIAEILNKEIRKIK